MDRWDTKASPNSRKCPNNWRLAACGCYIRRNSNEDLCEWRREGQHAGFRSNRCGDEMWYHVAGVKTSGAISIYVNGTLEGTVGVGPIHDTNSANLRIGSNAIEGAYLNGLVDEVELFNRALSATEIQAISNAGSAGKCKTPPTCVAPPSGMVSWWPGDGNANDIIAS